jgi:propionyl-CoA synthetase
MGTGAPQEVFNRSLKDPAGFWGEAAETVHWHQKWERVRDNSRPAFYRWFAGELNTCYNALDLHVEERRANQSALIYDSSVTNSITTFTIVPCATR